MTGPDLKPCPFCGTTEMLRTVGASDGHGWGFVRCDYCDAEGPDPDNFPGGWNRRTPDPAAEIARLTAERDAAQADAEDWARKCAAADEMRETAWEMGRDEAAAWCADEADKCADAAKWGGHRKYVADCKAASFALRNAWATIRALTPPADMAARIGGE